jgi:Holliday junction resolvase RusA-like endonuclease
MIVLNFYGKAEPAGSKTSQAIYRKGKDGRRVPVRGKTGRVLTTVRESNRKVEPYKKRLVSEAREQYDGPVLTGPLVVEMIFYEPRPKSHYGTGRNEKTLRDSAPSKPAKKPDALKLARGVEDALSGVVWTDDALTCDLIARKRYVGRHQQARVEVRIAPDPLRTVGDLVAAGLMQPRRPTRVDPDQLALPVAAA